MDEDGICLVLARTSELRSKITSCIHKAPNAHSEHDNQQENGDKDDPSTSLEKKIGEADREEEETENLLDIRDALESLEAQLSSLQLLQQQQGYEREAALAEIDYSREKLLKKLKEYKGEDLEVIHEASAFASEAVGDNNDLLLPPYPSRGPSSMFSDNGHLSHFTSTHKSAQNGVISGDPTNKTKKSLHESERNQVQNGSKKSSKGLGFFINAAAKTVLTFVGVVSLLTLAGFKPSLMKRDSQFKVFGLFRQQGTAAKKAIVQCPPGKVLVMEDGETRCIVKERVEIPFDSVVATPDVSYGCG
ncbi:plastid division protein PDV2 [Cornus florida]|uniref:plastid division protein PDV2 n=1 Tax=Cornus florida TaxID=4283 RepID=UPI002897D33A|nr:plastid division protein PDV2 [Cornus florida]